MNGQQWVTDIHGNNLHPMSKQNVEDVSAQKRARLRDMTEADFDDVLRVGAPKPEGDQE